MKKFILGVFLLSGLLFFAGCGGDESKSPSVTATLGGEKMKVKFASAQMLTGEQEGRDARALTITTQVNGNLLLISVSGWDFNGHPENGLLVKKYATDLSALPTGDCEYEGITAYCESGLITYWADDYYTSGIIEGFDGYVEITSSNPGSKRLSGKFYTKIGNDFEDEGQIIEGEFKDIPYIVRDF